MSLPGHGKIPESSRSSVVYSFTQTNIGTYNQLVDRLKDLSEGSSRSVPTGSKGSFSQVRGGREVVACVVSEEHIAYLLREGCVCRVRYREERPGPNPETKEKSDDDAASTSSARSRGSRSASPRPEGTEERGPSSSLGHSWSALLGSIGGSSGPSGVARLASRGRIQLLRRRGSGRGLIARWPIVPASEVPEHLVDRAMGVLQGKSRENVIRELQRTGLDVNQAVNNLLSRDDDEGEQEEAIAAFLPSGEELLSLLGGVGDEELEEVLGRVREEGGAGRESRAAHYDMADPLQSEIRSLVSLASGRDGGTGGDGGRRRAVGVREGSVAKSVLFEDCVEWWEAQEPDCRFVSIAALYSELLAVDSNGKLHCWPWCSPTPNSAHSHPLEEELGVCGERIRLIAARLLRASIVTESGKLATWLDHSVRAVSGRLEHRAQTFPELAGETVAQLHVCELFSVVLTESGKIFWWGMLPFSDRKQAILQAHERVRLCKYGGLGGGRAGEVVQGSKVCLRSSPIYGVGTRAIHLLGGRVQCGMLQESVFSSSLSEKCRFRVLSEGDGEEMEVDREGELSATLGMKRKIPDDEGAGEGEGKEEFWSLRNVIFTNGFQTLRAGTVVKVDGACAAVHFPALEPGEVASASLSNCRLLRKDELILSSEAHAHQTPYFAQESLKRLKLPTSYQPLAVACDHRGVHVLLSASSLLRYVQYSMTTGRFVQNAQFSESTSRFFLKHSVPVQFFPVGVALWLVRDANGGLYPLSRDHAGAIKDPPLLAIPPVSSVCVGPRGTDSQLCVVCVPRRAFLSAVIRCDLQAMKSCLSEKADLGSVLTEHCAGGCNVLHVLAWLGRPKEPSGSEGGRGVAARTTPRARLRELMKHARAMASGASPTFDPFVWGEEEEEEEEEGETSTGVTDAVKCLEWLCDFTAAHGLLVGLLKERNIEGYTPFMASTAYKAYGIALGLFDLAVMVSEGEDSLLAMLYPPESHPDDNPVFVLCRSDTCSFTWTGEEHIQQDIFECRTCNLTGSLCCCTECAYTCHRGHDCSFKRSSPTAYCDCWEKCKCRSLAPTPDSQRLALLTRLLRGTNLGVRVNSRREHLLGMLLGILARQAQEQGQWQSLRPSTSYRQRASKHEEVPPHDLPPPKFAQKAVSLVLEDWACVKVALGAREELEGGKEQPCTISVDALTYTLLAKLNTETLDSLLTRLVRQVGPKRRDVEAVNLCEKFLRCVIRVFTTCQIEALNIPQSSLSTARRKGATSKVADHAARALSSLAPLAVRPLVRIARALIHPVVMGVARPVDPLCMTDRHKTAEEMFRLPPPSLFRTPPAEDGHADDGTSDTESEAEDVGPVHDASSTATIGSNPIYLSSDQDSSDGEEVESHDNDGSVDGDSRHDDDLLMDHTPSHRVTLAPSSSHWALPSAHTPSHPTSSRLSRASTHGSREVCRDYMSMGVSASLLAQTFSLLMRQLVDILAALTSHLHPPTPPYILPTMDGEPEAIRDYIWAELYKVWVWLFAQVDMVECQVRLGNAMESSMQPQGRTDTSSEVLESRKDFLAYILSLMRSSYHEHGGVLPSLDLSALEHLAWTLDALYFLLKNSGLVLSGSEEQDLTQPDIAKFFRRSNSVSCLGAVPLSPFAPLTEALPLAEKPHLLDQEYPRPEVFGFDHPTVLEVWPKCPLPDPPIAALLKAPLPGLYGSQPGASQVPRLTTDHVCGITSCELAAGVLIGRWCNTVRLFARVFADTVGRVSASYLTEERVFESVEREFRREMDSLRSSSSHREVVIEVERGREKVLSAVFGQLNMFCDGRQTCTSSLPPLCVYRVKASFTGEPGEGSGVLRSLFTSFAEVSVLPIRFLPDSKPSPQAVLSEDPLPRLELSRSRNPPSPGPGFGSKGKLKDKLRSAKSSSLASRRASMERSGGRQPLFYQPGKCGFYAPCYATPTPERLNAYRNVGRVIGLSLLNCETISLPLCRHVLKYLLNKPVSWHDLAFFDPVMYESLRRLIVDARASGGREALDEQHLVFQVTLGEEEGGGVRELVPGGATRPVTPDNVYQYVRLYARLRMVEVSQAMLQYLRDGVHDVLPHHNLEALSAESLRLLLCGCPQIDVDVLRGITVFDDESRKSHEALGRFKGWFWSVLERMSQLERQDLLYFWTSSPLLPANVEAYQPPPSITIRPSDDQRLPTANTCISRLYIPLYSSKAILRLRLLTAIKTKTFGFV